MSSPTKPTGLYLPHLHELSSSHDLPALSGDYLATLSCPSLQRTLPLTREEAEPLLSHLDTLAPPPATVLSRAVFALRKTCGCAPVARARGRVQRCSCVGAWPRGHVI